VTQINPAETVDAGDEEPDALRRWISPEHVNGDVGAFSRFCVPAPSDERRAVCRCLEQVTTNFSFVLVANHELQHDAPRHGHLLRGLFLSI
jgi:hypothetical protein